MRSAKASVRWAGIVACLGAAAACNAISGVGKFSYDGSGGNPSGSSSTSSSGSGPCTSADDCPPVPPGPCAMLGTKTCMGGQCGVTYMVKEAPSQVYGDCRKNLCDSTGAMTTVADDTDVFDSGNQCMPYKCTNGVLNLNLMPGSNCTLPGSLSGTCVLDPDTTNPGVYVCSECDPNNPASCVTKPGTACDHGTCRPSHCTDTSNTPDVNETDVNCGGPDCAPCGTMKICGSASDCFSHQCNNKLCLPPSCTDGWQDQNESDVDCGGSCPSPCDDMKMCNQAADCKSGVCRPTGSGTPDRCAAPTCTDGVKNGGETGVDCGGDGDGGPACPPCAM